MISFLNSPFPRPAYTRKNIIKVFLFGVVMALFVMVFQPFDIRDKTGVWFYNGIVLVAGLVFSAAIYTMEFLIPKLLKSRFKDWTFWKALLWYTWLVLFVSAVMFLGKSFLDGFSAFNFVEYLKVIGRMTALTLIILFFVLGFYSYFTKNTLTQASATTTITITSPQASPIKLTIDDILFIESADNYVEVHVFSKGRIEKIVHRSSLKNMERQLVNPLTPIERCHRQFLINLNRCEIQSSKSRNTTLRLKDTAATIPVSAKYEKGILKKLRARH